MANATLSSCAARRYVVRDNTRKSSTPPQSAMVNGQEPEVTAKLEDAWERVCESWEERADILGGDEAYAVPSSPSVQSMSKGLQLQVESTDSLCTIYAPSRIQIGIPIKDESEGLRERVESTNESCTVSSRSQIQIKSEGLRLQVESTGCLCTISAPSKDQVECQGLLQQVESTEEACAVSTSSTIPGNPFTGLASDEQQRSGFSQVGQQFGADDQGGFLLGGDTHGRHIA